MIYVADTFFLKWTTFLNESVDGAVRVPIGVALLVGAICLAKVGQDIVFGPVREEPRVIRNGVYALVRHPLHLAEALLYLGLLSLSMSLAAAVVWLGDSPSCTMSPDSRSGCFWRALATSTPPTFARYPCGFLGCRSFGRGKEARVPDRAPAGVECVAREPLCRIKVILSRRKETHHGRTRRIVGGPGCRATDVL